VDYISAALQVEIINLAKIAKIKFSLVVCQAKICEFERAIGKRRHRFSIKAQAQ